MKTFKIILISLFVIILLSQPILAIGDIISTSEDWAKTGKQHTNIAMDTKKLKNVSNDLYNILLAIAVGVAIIVGAILGIQYMTAGINKRVEVKESLFPYLISCAIVFGSLGIWKLVVSIMNSVK